MLILLSPFPLPPDGIVVMLVIDREVVVELLALAFPLVALPPEVLPETVASPLAEYWKFVLLT
jgi:hypothetical protein